MRNFLLLFFAVITMSVSAQGPYWTCYNLEVDPEGVEEVVASLDLLFESEMAMDHNYTIILSEVHFNNESIPMTHQVCFLGENADAFANWTGGPPPTAAGATLAMTFAQYVKIHQSILGAPLMFDPEGLNYAYGNIWQLRVKDPMKVAGALKALEDGTDFDGVFELHQAISGSRDGITHYMVARAADMTSWLKGREHVISSDAFKGFNKSMQEAAEIVASFAVKRVKVYTPKAKSDNTSGDKN